MANLMIANPPRRRRKASSRKRTTVARRFSALPVFASRGPRRARRRRSGGSGLSLGGGGSLVSTGKTIAIQGVTTAAGFVAADLVLDRIAPNYAFLQTPRGRALAKFALGAATAFFGRRFLPKYAGSLAAGMAANGARDLWLNYQANKTTNVSGLGIGETGGVEFKNGMFGLPGGIAGRISGIGSNMNYAPSFG